MTNIYCQSRKSALTFTLVFVFLALLMVPLRTSAASQKKPAAVTPPPPLLKRTTTRREVKRLGHGATVTLNGAPDGSITIEGSPRSEVELIADIEVSATSEDELSRLAAVTGFAVESDFNRLRVTTVGTHDRKYMKRVARDFPKKLLSMPWKVDYKLRVPAVVDLEIATGSGPLLLAGVEGAVRLTAGGGASLLTLSGGDFEGTMASGPITVRVTARSWRGRGFSLRVASGDLTVELPAGFNGDVDADVLRTGRVENSHPNLTPRDDIQPTERMLRARGGDGGARLTFTVGDGTLRITGSKQ